MQKNFSTFFTWFALLSTNFLTPGLLEAQETRIFTTEDYDLNGPARSCQVLASYGREEFEFNKDGKLTKAVTRYNDNDYSITYYKYNDGQLVERRDEVYREGNFDEKSSLAHFFQYDSLPQPRIVEQILNYNKEFIDRYEYYYDEEGQLRRILRSSQEGVDETRIDYSSKQGEQTTTYFMNEILLKTVRESEKKGPDGKPQKVVLTKEYLDGAPDKALEQVYNPEGQIISEVRFNYSNTEKSFVPVEKTSYGYSDNGVLSTVETQERGQTTSRNYIFQFDASGNWIKKIITPDNAYTTRRISYYPTQEPGPAEND